MDERERMDRRPPWIPWAIASLAFLLVAVLAFAFGRYEPMVASGAPVMHGHFGFPFFGIFLVFLFICMFRRGWWWGGYPYYRSWHYRRRYYDPRDDEREWQEWHRREHERMDQSKGDRA